MDENRILLLLHRYLGGDCSDDEAETVRRWVKASPENRAKFEQIRRIYEVDPAWQHPVDPNRAWKRFREKYMHKRVDCGVLDLPDAGSSRSSQNRDTNMKNSPGRKQTSRAGRLSAHRDLSGRKDSGSRGVILRIAAFLVMGLIVTAAGFQYFDIDLADLQERHAETDEQVLAMDATHSKVREYHAERGARLYLDLPDGSRVILNSGSTLYVDPEFESEQRMVALEGEAYFQVEQQVANPFLVATEEAEVRVLGTEFNVTSWPEQDKAEVLVTGGKVEVSLPGRHAEDRSQQSSTAVLLEAGERSVVSAGNAPIVDRMQQDMDRRLSWRRGGVFFDNQELGHVLQYLERRFDANFQVEDSSAIRDRVYAYYRDESLEEILDMTSITHDVRFDRQDDRIIVR